MDIQLCLSFWMILSHWILRGEMADGMGAGTAAMGIMATASEKAGARVVTAQVTGAGGTESPPRKDGGGC